MTTDAVEKVHTSKPKSARSNSAAKHIAVPVKWDIEDIEKEFFKAFERGEAHARKKDREEFEETLNKNINKAFSLSETIFSSVFSDFKIKHLRAFMKIVAIDHFETLLAVSKEDYLNPVMTDVYKSTNHIKKTFNDDKFRIDFRIMPLVNELNEDLVRADGYTIEYVGK